MRHDRRGQTASAWWRHPSVTVGGSCYRIDPHPANRSCYVYVTKDDVIVCVCAYFMISITRIRFSVVEVQLFIRMCESSCDSTSLLCDSITRDVDNRRCLRSDYSSSVFRSSCFPLDSWSVVFILVAQYKVGTDIYLTPRWKWMTFQATTNFIENERQYASRVQAVCKQSV